MSCNKSELTIKINNNHRLQRISFMSNDVEWSRQDIRTNNENNINDEINIVENKKSDENNIDDNKNKENNINEIKLYDIGKI